MHHTSHLIDVQLPQEVTPVEDTDDDVAGYSNGHLCSGLVNTQYRRYENAWLTGNASSRHNSGNLSEAEFGRIFWGWKLRSGTVP